MFGIATASRIGRLVVVDVVLAGGLTLLASTAGPAMAQSARTPSPAGAAEYFESPRQGEHLSSPFVVKPGVHGMGVSPSFTSVPNTGHHDLLIDSQLGSADAPLPSGNNVVRLGNGETETRITLSTGWHTLQLVFTDGNDMSFDPPLVSQPIRIYVHRR